MGFVSRRWAIWVPVLLWMVLIFSLSSMREPRFADVGLVDLAVKKIGHFCLYLVLAFGLASTVGRLLDDTRWERRGLQFALGLAILFAVSDELHQAFTPTRDPSIIDVGIDTAGAVAGILASRFVVHIRSKRAHRRAPETN